MHCSTRRRILLLTTQHQDLLKERLADALRAGMASLPEKAAAETTIDLHRVASTSISQLTEESMSAALAGDVIAGVCQRFEGRLTGSALIALDPADALIWLQLGDDGEDPLARFVDRGSRLLGAVIRCLAELWHTSVELGACGLEERPLAAALLSTHCATDTVVLYLDGEIRFDIIEGGPQLHSPYSIHILLEPKLLGAILTRLLADQDFDCR